MDRISIYVAIRKQERLEYYYDIAKHADFAAEREVIHAAMRAAVFQVVL